MVASIIRTIFASRREHRRAPVRRGDTMLIDPLKKVTMLTDNQPTTSYGARRHWRRSPTSAERVNRRKGRSNAAPTSVAF
jgi:hypothetical protein